MARLLATQGLQLWIENDYGEAGAPPRSPAVPTLLGPEGAGRIIRVARVSHGGAPHYVPVINGAHQSAPADGNCFFHSVAQLLTPEEHTRLLGASPGGMQDGALCTPQRLREALARYVDAHWDDFSDQVLNESETTNAGGLLARTLSDIRTSGRWDTQAADVIPRLIYRAAFERLGHSNRGIKIESTLGGYLVPPEGPQAHPVHLRLVGNANGM